MNKFVPMKGYALIKFQADGEMQLPPEALAGEKTGVVVVMGAYEVEYSGSGGSGASGSGGGVTFRRPGFDVGDRIYFTEITGRIFTQENDSYAFINYKDVYGKELK